MENRNVEFTVKMREFKAKLRATQFAASNDMSLPVLNCIKMQVDNGELLMVATDRYKMIATRMKLSEDKPFSAGTVLVDHRALKYLGMMGADSFDELTVRVDGGNVQFATSEESVTVSRPDVEYPPVEKLIGEALEEEPDGQVRAYGARQLEVLMKSLGSVHRNDVVVIHGVSNKADSRLKPTLFYGGSEPDWVALLTPIKLKTDLSDAIQAARDAFAGLLK